MDETPTRPYKGRVDGAVIPGDDGVVYERRNLEEKRRASREAMRRKRARDRAALAEAANSAVELSTTVDDNKDGE